MQEKKYINIEFYIKGIKVNIYFLIMDNLAQDKWDKYLKHSFKVKQHFYIHILDILVDDITMDVNINELKEVQTICHKILNDIDLSELLDIYNDGEEPDNEEPDDD